MTNEYEIAARDAERDYREAHGRHICLVRAAEAIPWWRPFAKADAECAADDAMWVAIRARGRLDYVRNGLWKNTCL